jgi:8-oxo-dGTP diphosphatase
MQETMTPTAAVAIVKKTDKTLNEQYLILRRTTQPGDPWSGHFSFPGGCRESEDKDLLSTCIRETREETGLILSSHQLELRLPLEPAGQNINSLIWVRPFLFSINSTPSLTLNPEEIQSYTWLDADHFKEPTHHQEVEMIPGKLFPAYPIEDYYLWGFTYRLLMNLLKN